MASCHRGFVHDHLDRHSDYRDAHDPEAHRAILAQVNLSPAEEVMEAIRGATIVHGDASDGEGLHLHFADGRLLVVTVIRGCLALAVLSADKESVH